MPSLVYGSMLSRKAKHFLDNFASSNSDNDAKIFAAEIWDVNTGRLLRTLTGHTATVNDAEFSYDGQRVVTASSDGSARVWDANSGSLLQMLRSQRRYLYS